MSHWVDVLSLSTYLITQPKDLQDLYKLKTKNKKKNRMHKFNTKRQNLKITRL